MDAERFAAMWAGLDTGNDEAEAMAKFRMLRRKVIASNQRIIDVLELPEVKAALDAQMQPVRHGDTSVLQAENEELRARLAVVMPKVTELAEALKEGTRRTEPRLSMDACRLAGSADRVAPFSRHDRRGDCLWDVRCSLLDRKGTEIMNYGEMLKEQIEKLKEAVGPVFDKTARICLVGNVSLYVACCVMAEGPVGPVKFVAFLYHCCQWKVQ